LFKAEEELWFGDFGINLFLFFKILIVNQDIHVFQYFYILKLYPCLCIYLYVIFLRYLQKRVDFLTVRFTVHRPFLIFDNFFVFPLQ
jgi:hypothetical protein